MLPSANANFEGRAIVEVELVLPNGKIIPFSQINISHISSSLRESIKKTSDHILTVRSPTIDYVDTLLRYAQSQGTPLINFRIGIGFPSQIIFLPWQQYTMTHFVAAHEGLGESAGHFVTITLKDALYNISRNTSVAAYRGLISDIVNRIIIEDGISDAVVEPTVGEGLWVQNFVDDEDFIRNRLMMRAVNDKGRGNYNFYVQDNIVHFHSPDYQAQLKQLVYYQANTMKLSQLDESQNMLELGEANVRVIAYDPYTATASEIISDPTRALRLGNVIHTFDDLQGVDLHYPYHLSINTVLEAKNMAQSIYEKARSQAMGLLIEVARTIFLRVGDFVQVGITPSGNKSSVWSGVYQVVDSATEIKQGAMVTSFIVKRGEFQTTNLAPTTITILGQELIVNNQAAPGQPLSIKLAASSPLTHGTGQAGSTSIFVDTSDTDTAPNPSPAF
jgi:hypothetical protein